ncbi:uncharacterized protein DNG_01564 [Cephalotrichum gorgonifer]|uniref:Uncharacterized protein n=1 Tax=Cephalotrichum gorgonifer TaxID=2041049 RepID=A0AAE8MS23_9PEZI|nr:uncharacterized protein DNG_01564 [Cephalotrichum gorgonifer]
MESSPPSASAAAPPNDTGESVRQEDLFMAFDTYPWIKDPKFMTLIKTSLQRQTPTPEATIRHARTAYFTRVLGFPLSPPAYAAFLAAHPSHVAPDAALLASVVGGPSAPAWQSAAPKTELYIDRAAAGGGGGGGPAYPERFAELIRCIKEGKPVPGVREIPDTILRDPSAKPVGSRPAPRKPWERDDVKTETATGAGVTPPLDQDFPPLDTTDSSAQEHKTTAEGTEEQLTTSGGTEGESKLESEEGTTEPGAATDSQGEPSVETLRLS